MPGPVMPGPVMPGPVIPDAIMPGAVMPGAVMPGAVMPGAVMPGAGTSSIMVGAQAIAESNRVKKRKRQFDSQKKEGASFPSTGSIQVTSLFPNEKRRKTHEAAPTKQRPPTLGDWTRQEDKALALSAQRACGHLSHFWGNCASALPNRTKNQCRKRWFAHIRPRIISLSLRECCGKRQKIQSRVKANLYEAVIEGGHRLTWEFPFRICYDAGVAFVSELFCFCVVLNFGSLVDTSCELNDPHRVRRVEDLNPRSLFDLCSNLSSDACALSLIDGVAEAFASGKYETELTRRLLSSLSVISEYLICLVNVYVDLSKPLGVTLASMAQRNHSGNSSRPKIKPVNQPTRRLWLTIAEFDKDRANRQIDTSLIGFTLDKLNGKIVKTAESFTDIIQEARQKDAVRMSSAAAKCNDFVSPTDPRSSFTSACLVLFCRRSSISIFSPLYRNLWQLSYSMAYHSLLIAKSFVKRQTLAKNIELSKILRFFPYFKMVKSVAHIIVNDREGEFLPWQLEVQLQRLASLSTSEANAVRLVKDLLDRWKRAPDQLRRIGISDATEKSCDHLSLQYKCPCHQICPGFPFSSCSWWFSCNVCVPMKLTFRQSSELEFHKALSGHEDKKATLSDESLDKKIIGAAVKTRRNSCGEMRGCDCRGNNQTQEDPIHNVANEPASKFHSRFFLSTSNSSSGIHNKNKEFMFIHDKGSIDCSAREIVSSAMPAFHAAMTAAEAEEIAVLSNIADFFNLRRVGQDWAGVVDRQALYALLLSQENGVEQKLKDILKKIGLKLPKRSTHFPGAQMRQENVSAPSAETPTPSSHSSSLPSVSDQEPTSSAYQSQRYSKLQVSPMELLRTNRGRKLIEFLTIRANAATKVRPRVKFAL